MLLPRPEIKITIDFICLEKRARGASAIQRSRCGRHGGDPDTAGRIVEAPGAERSQRRGIVPDFRALVAADAGRDDRRIVGGGFERQWRLHDARKGFSMLRSGGGTGNGKGMRRIDYNPEVFRTPVCPRHVYHAMEITRNFEPAGIERRRHGGWESRAYFAAGLDAAFCILLPRNIIGSSRSWN
jgi:hypothetical protein